MRYDERAGESVGHELHFKQECRSAQVAVFALFETSPRCGKQCICRRVQQRQESSLMACPRTLQGRGRGEGRKGDRRRKRDKAEVRNVYGLVVAGILCDFGPGEPERPWFR